MRCLVLSLCTLFALASAPGWAQASQPAPREGPASQPAPREGPASQPAPHEGPASQPAPVHAPAPVAAAPGPAAPAEPAADDDTFGSFVGMLQSAPVSATAGGYSDSPGPADSANVLPSGAGLFHFALALSSTPDATLLLQAAQVDAPQLRLRFGVFDVAEATGDLVYTVDTDEGGQVRARVSHLSVGGRVKLLEEGGFWPAAAVGVRFGLPLDTLELRHSGLIAQTNVQKTLAERLTLTGNALFTYDGLTERFAFGGAMAASVYVGAGMSFFGAGSGELDLDLMGNIAAHGGGAYDVGSFLRLDLTVSSEMWPNLGAWGVRTGATVFFDGF